MAYDSACGVTVLFGGVGWDYPYYLADTWEWNDGTWTRRSDGPSSRTEAAMAYDSARGVTVLFGGQISEFPGYFGDTWEYRSCDSTPPALSISPPSASITHAGPVRYTATYTDPDDAPSAIAVTLGSADITLNRTGTANGTVSVRGTGNTRTVTISNIIGEGTLGISIAANTASDPAGNHAAAAGPSATFTVERGGVVAAWGRDSSGQCDVPAPDKAFRAVEAGYAHSLGLKADGSIVAWGGDSSGQCDVPAPNANFVAVSAGYLHSLGLKADGSILGWGQSDQGQCNVPSPNSGFVAMAAGGGHSLGLKSDGSIVAWGDDTYGQCDVPTPNSGFVAVSAGYLHSLGLRSDGSLVAWGHDGYGQCDLPTPNSGFVAIVAGQTHSLGLKSDGSLVAWGNNYYGQCDVPSPNGGFTAIAAGYHSLGLKADGSVVGWGMNTHGQCDVPSPNGGFLAIAAGAFHSLGIRRDVDNDGVPDVLDNCPDTVPGAVVDAQGCPAIIPFDFNRDGAVDDQDLLVFEACMTGPAITGLPYGCSQETLDAADRDHDGDVDLVDFAALQRCFSGRNNPADPNCAD